MACIAALVGAACAPRRPLPEEASSVPGQTGGPAGGNGGRASAGDGGGGGAVAGGGGAVAGTGGTAGAGGVGEVDAGDGDGAAAPDTAAPTGNGGAGGARACRYEECGPPPDRSRSCLDNLQPEWICARDAAGACLWRADACTPRCTNINDVSLCSKVPGCFALVLGCAESRDLGSLCLRVEQVRLSGGCDRSNCPGGGFSPTGCNYYVVDSCTLATGRYGPDCRERVCRDTLIQVCEDGPFY